MWKTAFKCLKWYGLPQQIVLVFLLTLNMTFFLVYLLLSLNRYIFSGKVNGYSCMLYVTSLVTDTTLQTLSTIKASQFEKNDLWLYKWHENVFRSFSLLSFFRLFVFFVFLFYVSTKFMHAYVTFSEQSEQY